VSQTPLGTAIAEQASTMIDDNNKGYKLSDHIRKYYKTTLV
jgi:hypothetical protein